MDTSKPQDRPSSGNDLTLAKDDVDGSTVPQPCDAEAAATWAQPVHYAPTVWKLVDYGPPPA